MSVHTFIITTDIKKPLIAGDDFIHYLVDDPMLGPVTRMQEVYELCKTDPPSWLLLVHDDVEVFSNMPSIDDVTKDYRVAIVGLGGATGIGTADIYKTPYHIHQLARQNYSSNQIDWATHGTHETGVKKVAVVDGFFLAIRWKFLEEIGGFSWMKTRFHCYDLALCLEAYRRGWEVRMIGLSCMHHGGRTSTTPEYVQWCEAQGTTPALEHSQPHVWLYDRYRDLLPFHV